MIAFLTSFISLLLIFFATKILFKNFKSKFFKKHQKFAGKKSIPLIGGIIIYSYLCLYFNNFDFNFLLFSFFLLIIGLLSDNNFLGSPKIRLILQTLFLGFFVYFSDLNISDLRDDLLNELISYYYIKIFFITFCFLVLINGSNFIDGLDGLNLGYFLSITIVVLFLNYLSKISIDQNQIFIILYVVLFLFILNMFNVLYLGDSGSYLIGFLFGVILIEIYDKNSLISPYFIALMLWYPAFENLFSIIRKRLVKVNPLNPDNLHLHQLLFLLIKNQKQKFLRKYSNCVSSLIIIFYNLLIFLISIKYINNTRILLALLIFNVFIYLITYLFLKKKLI